MARRGGRCGALLGGESALSGGGELALLLGEERGALGGLALGQGTQGILGQAVQGYRLAAARHAFAFTVRRKKSQNMYRPIRGVKLRPLRRRRDGGRAVSPSMGTLRSGDDQRSSADGDLGVDPGEAVEELAAKLGVGAEERGVDGEQA
jgi:hypothetical protein